MARRTNPVAWGLAVILATTVPVAGGVLLTHGIHVTRVEVEWVPVRSWCLGLRTFTSCGEPGRTFIEARMVRLFFVDVTVR
jgi:hypothetical protein